MTAELSTLTTAPMPCGCITTITLTSTRIIAWTVIGKGNISHKQAIEKAEKEFEIYRKREMELLESDFDKEIKRFKDK